MGNVFSGSEVVELGIQIEKNGRDFYNALIERSKDGAAKNIYDFLAKEEERHIAVFKKLLESVEKYEPQEAYPGEYFEYMNALAGEYVFTRENKGAEAAKKIKNDREAVETGIGFEKDSIIFYEGMKKVVPEYDSKTVEELITQEKMHLRKLYGLKSSIKASPKSKGG